MIGVNMHRRTFLKGIAASLASLQVIPVRAFVPPREPFVQMNRKGLDALVSHLGVLPVTRELSTCEGVILDMEAWDGTGYPCLVQNVCTFGPQKPQAWVYDFDLWNFRHDDHLGPLHLLPEFQGFNSHAAFHASRRFGEHWIDVVRKGGGFISRQIPAGVG